MVAPGLEELARLELKTWGPDLVPVVDRGGLTLRTELARGLGLNSCLKIPTRILIRIADFGCRDFPKLFKKLSNLDWSRWIADDRVVDFKASSHGSRLFVKKRIEETCADGRKAYLKKKGAQPKAESEPITVYVRLADDVCFVSLDTSGERLHKRGHRELSSDAPLRESIASALLWALEADAKLESTETIELVDPMCGAGTFFLEASGLKARIDSREYAFESWGGTEIAGSHAIESSSARDVYASFVGFDNDAKAIRSATKNWETAGVPRPCRFIEGDFFAAAPLEKGPRRWLICNPPYGERIGVEGRLSSYYEKLFVAVAEKIRPERACFLL
ncbi:MAG: hypothetical protein AAB250_04780, partial [Bdellovibrionota bacterium]